VSEPLAVVIGVGNPMRRDDGVGWAVVDALADPACAGEPGVRLVRLDGEPARLVDAWTGAALAVVVDAARGSGAAGEVEVEDPYGGRAEARPAVGSHALGVDDAVALGAALGRLPARLVLVRVLGADFGNGEGLSPAVAAAVPTAAAAARAALGSR